MKILFFDYWLKGIANFERLVPELQRRGCTDIRMVHVGSWKNPQDGLVHEHNGFKSYDIQHYHTYSFYKVLKMETPDVVVTMNLYFLMDKAIVVFCKKLGIKVVYMAHGRMLTKSDQFSDYLKKDLKKGLLGKIRIDTIAYLYNYWLSTFISKKPLRFLITLCALVKDPASMTLYSSYTEELAADKLLLFYESDKTEYVCKRNFPDRNMTIVGNPELDGYIQSKIEDKEDFLRTLGVKSKAYLLYLDDGNVEARTMGKADWYDMLTVYTEICKRHGLTLVVKLHPRTNQAEHQTYFDSQDIVAVKKVNFRNIVEHAYAVTSLMSTTITMPLISGKRVISPRWGCFTDFDKSYPEDVIRYVYTPEEFERVLISDEPTDRSKKYVKESIGIVDGHAIERIVEEIIS